MVNKGQPLAQRPGSAAEVTRRSALQSPTAANATQLTPLQSTPFKHRTSDVGGTDGTSPWGSRPQSRQQASEAWGSRPQSRQKAEANSTLRPHQEDAEHTSTETGGVQDSSSMSGASPVAPKAKKASKAKAKSKKSNRKLQPLYHDSLRPPLQPMFERNVEKFGPWISRSIASVKATSRELGVTDQHCFEAQGVIGAGHHGDASERWTQGRDVYARLKRLRADDITVDQTHYLRKFMESLAMPAGEVATVQTKPHQKAQPSGGIGGAYKMTAKEEAAARSRTSSTALREKRRGKDGQGATLDLSFQPDGERFTDEDMLRFAKAFPRSLGVLMLDFSGCADLGRVGLDALSQSLQRNLLVVNLNFSRCHLVDDTCMTVLATGLPPSLRELTLLFWWCSRITDLGAKAIGERMPQVLSFIRLDFFACNKISSFGAACIVTQLPLTLERVTLSFVQTGVITSRQLLQLQEARRWQKELRDAGGRGARAQPTLQPTMEMGPTLSSSTTH